jgi:hypothetical protein
LNDALSFDGAAQCAVTRVEKIRPRLQSGDGRADGVVDDVDAMCSRLSGPCFYFCPASIAASTFGGDIGSSVSRRPVARSIALAMAAIGGQMLTSAAPLAP